MWQFFAQLNHKYLGSTMLNIENGRTILSIYNLFWKQYTSHWIILKWLRACRERWSSQKSIEIRNRDIVFCRLEMGNCVNFLLERMLISLCWPMRVVKTNIYFWTFASPNRISNHSNNLVRYLKTNRRVLDSSGKTRCMGVRAKIDRV